MRDMTLKTGMNWIDLVPDLVGIEGWSQNLIHIRSTLWTKIMYKEICVTYILIIVFIPYTE